MRGRAVGKSLGTVVYLAMKGRELCRMILGKMEGQRVLMVAAVLLVGGMEDQLTCNQVMCLGYYSEPRSPYQSNFAQSAHERPVENRYPSNPFAVGFGGSSREIDDEEYSQALEADNFSEFSDGPIDDVPAWQVGKNI
ncbi:hypothetical protein HK104_008167 [Borealophlyctis nickersoniae]|nr:hypothetical protein HK104_008167 [Borealophlyctis nickersoniae]